VTTPVSLGPLRLPAPVLAASGSLGYGAVPVGPRGPVEQGGGGSPPVTPAAVTSGIAWRTRGGTPPRLVEAAAGAVYLPGTSALGAADAVRRFGRAWATRQGPVVVNLRGTAAGELPLAAAEIQGLAGVVALELDLTALDDSADPAPQAVRQILHEVRLACDLPLLVKLPPDLPDPWETLRAAAAGGAVAATFASGLPALSGVEAGAGRRAGGPGGAGDLPFHGRLVGPATFPVVLALIARLAGDAPLPLIACGGVTGAEAARAYLAAGAAAVQVGSAHLAQPDAAETICAALS
jgi:dihydroorotate dehydrogenase (NAD+) catalytic subunit